MNQTIILLRIEFLYSPVVNYAIQQNKVPLARKLSIENSSEIDIQNVQIQIECEPEFASFWAHRIDIIPSKQSVIINPKDFKLSAHYLSELTEKISGEIKLTVKSNEELIFQDCYTIDILAYDQWNGIGVLPEIMAAFVTPNHPEISKIIRSASEVLNRWTDTYRFSDDLIREACERALANTGKVSFSYADKILSDWSAHNIRTLSDVKKKDSQHINTRAKAPSNAPKTTSFQDFTQRPKTSSDLSELERKLLQ